MSKVSLIPTERIEQRILHLRGQKVMLDFQLAELYEVETKALNQAVKRNIDRFPEDFMFQLTEEEAQQVPRSQIVTLEGDNWSQSVTRLRGSASKPTEVTPGNRSQFVTGSQKHRDPKLFPYAFTEQGVAMLSSVLRSQRAVQVNIAIMRAFVQLRQMLASNKELSRRLDELEGKYDEQFKVVFEAIRELMEPDTAEEAARREIGFHVGTPLKVPKSRLNSRKRTS